MKRLLTGLGLTAAMVLVLAAAAFGQAPAKHDLELNLFMGGSAYSSSSFQVPGPLAPPPFVGPPSSVPANFQFKTSIRGGVRLSVYNRGHWGEEFFYSYEPNTLHYDREYSPPNILDLPLQIHNFGANGLYYFNEDETANARPFVTFGLGATNYRLTQASLNAAHDPTIGNLPGFGGSTSLTFNYGIGFKEKIASHLGFRVDVHHFIGRNPSFSLPRSNSNLGASVFPANGAIHNVEASAGLVIYLGR